VPETIARFFTNYPQLAGLRGLRFAAVIEECDRLAFNPPLKTWEGDKLHRLSQVAEVPWVPWMQGKAVTLPHPVISVPYSDVDDGSGTTEGAY